MTLCLMLSEDVWVDWHCSQFSAVIVVWQSLLRKNSHGEDSVQKEQYTVIFITTTLFQNRGVI